MRDGRTRDGVLRLLCISWSGWLILAHFQLSAIFRREDVFALQVFRGVNVLGFFLLAFFAGAFLTGRFRNILVFLILLLLSFLLRLGAALRCTKENEGENQKGRHTPTQRAEGGLYGSQAADPGWGVEIRTCHSKPIKTGDNAWKKVYPKRPFLDTTTFLERGLPGPGPVPGGAEM